MAKRFETYQGKTQCITEWAKDLGVDRKYIWKRMALGETFAEAVEQRNRREGPRKEGMIVHDAHALHELQRVYRSHPQGVSWTKDDLVKVFRLWRATYGRYPQAAECRKEFCLPSSFTVIRHFGRWSHLIAHLDDPQTPLRHQKPGETVECLLCEGRFVSWDKRKNRLCKLCNDRINTWTDDEDMDWMCGGPASFVLGRER